MISSHTPARETKREISLPSVPCDVAEILARFRLGDDGLIYEISTGKVKCRIGVRGYRLVTVGKKRVLAHRIAWALHYGEWPLKFLDHINRDRGDNRISNLRETNSRQNCRNSDRFNGGATWREQYQKWQAQIWVNGTCKYLGFFKTKDEATAAYDAAAAKLEKAA